MAVMKGPFRNFGAVFTGSLQDSPPVPPAKATETYHRARFNRVKGALLEKIHMTRLKLLVLAGLLAAPLPLQAATPGAVQTTQGPAMPGPDGGFGRHHGGGKLAGMFSPQQRVAFMLQAREQTRDMSRDQKQAWRKDQLQKLSSMSEPDRQKFKTDLQARWDALPADRKARMEQRMVDRKGPSPTR
jgi:hypothetical protein